MTAEATRYPLQYGVQYPERLSRWKIFVKGLLAIPHFIILYALTVAGEAVTFVAFFAILFTRRYPRGLFEFVVGVFRWQANLNAYLGLQRDEYPPFSMGEGQYPVTYRVEYPERLSRWLIFVKWLLAVPHLVVVGLLGLLWWLSVVVAWFAILFTGRYPRTLFDFAVGVFRWNYRVNAYTWLLRDEYPPFSMAP